MSVEYRQIDGFPGYRVGSDGTVWSRMRWGGREADVLCGDWRQLKLDQRKYGHQYVTLRNESVRARFQVHHLVLQAFIGPRPHGLEGCHEDGNASNNSAGNLRWGTHKSNMEDRSRHRTLSGERHGRAVINQEQADAIRKRWQAGEKVAALAREFGISESQGHRVAKGQQWK